MSADHIVPLHIVFRRPGDDARASSNPPTQAEAQANRDKINKLLNRLRAAGIINT